MGYQIIKQPDGLFAIRSSCTDTIILWNGDRADVIEWFTELAREDAIRQTERVLKHVENDQPRDAYYQFTVTWDEALADDRENDGQAWRDFTKDATSVPTGGAE